jgi:hypothetical protein
MMGFIGRHDQLPRLEINDEFEAAGVAPIGFSARREIIFQPRSVLDLGAAGGTQPQHVV